MKTAPTAALFLAAILCGCGAAADVTDTARDGQVEVTVTAISIGPIQVGHEGETPRTSEKAYLLIELQIHNITETAKLDYRTWGGCEAAAANAGKATVADEFGNTYKRLNLGLWFPIRGQLRSESIRPGETVRDLLVYERPIDKAAAITLDLPATAYGGTGTLTIRGTIER